jgi:hypothetical protein
MWPAMMKWMRRIAAIVAVTLLVLVGCVAAGLVSLRLAAHFRETEVAASGAH